jgi:4-amino-4-deoxy-L-arabinose transferase-like glycosyltransferase
MFATLSRYPAIILFAAGALISFGGIAFTPIYILDEARNAVCAIEMMHRGDWIVPTFNEQLRVEKPTLHCYFMILGYKIFGINPFGARFFSALFGIATAFVIYLFANRYFSKRLALLTAFLMFSSLHVSLQFQLSTPDPYLIFFNTVSILLVYIGGRENKKWLTRLGYVAMALSVWAKGPIGILLPGGAFLLYLLISGQFTLASIRKFRPIEGTMIALAVALPWYVTVALATDGAWPEGFFLKQNIGRFTSTMEGHGGTVFLMPILLILAFLPFSGFVVPAFGRWWRERKGSDVLALAGSAAIFTTLFFSISSTRLPSYISPAFPFAAMVVAVYLDKWIDQGKVVRWPFVAVGVLGTGLSVGGYFGLRADLDVSHLAFFAGAFLPLAIGGFVAAVFASKSLVKNAILTSGLGAMAAIVLVQWFAMPAIYAENPVQHSAEMLQGKDVVAFKRFNPGYAFYLGTPIKEYDDAESLKASLLANSEALILTQERYLKDLDMSGFEILFSQKDLFERQTSVVLRQSR